VTVVVLKVAQYCGVVPQTGPPPWHPRFNFMRSSPRPLIGYDRARAALQL
jgi:hypothetical protein